MKIIDNDSQTASAAKATKGSPKSGRFWLMALGVLFATGALIGCSDDDDNGVQPDIMNGSAYVRVGHLSPDAPAVDVWVDGNVALEDVEFRQFSAYVELDAGDHQILVSPANQTSPIVINADVTLEEDTYYTVTAVGLLDQIEPVVMIDDRSIDGSNARIRFAHASPDAPAVDITLPDGTILFANAAFADVADFIAVPSAEYDLQVRVAGTETVALSFGDVALSPGTVYTIYATGLLGDGSIEATVSVDSPGDGSTVVGISPAMSMLRVGHLSPDAPAVDIYLDNAPVAGLSGVPFKAVSGYLEVGASTHNIKVYVSGTTANPVIDATLTLLPNTSYTVAATGLAGEGDLSPLVLIDDRSGPDSMGSASVRFVHTSPDAPAVNIVVQDGPTLFSNVEFRSFAGYTDVASGSYDLEARLSEGDALALSLPEVLLSESNSFTVFAVGLAGDGSLGVVIVEDTP